MHRRTFILLAVSAATVTDLPIFQCPVEPIKTRYEFSEALAVMEGWNSPKSLVRILHNPGALVFAFQRKAIRHPTGYAQFKTDADGWLALQLDLAVKKQIGMSLSDIIVARTPYPHEQLRCLAILRSWGFPV